MPVMNGFESAKLIKKLINPPYLIAVTGSDEESEKLLCLSIGFDAYLTKPINFETVIQIIGY